MNYRKILLPMLAFLLSFPCHSFSQERMKNLCGVTLEKEIPSSFIAKKDVFNMPQCKYPGISYHVPDGICAYFAEIPTTMVEVHTYNKVVEGVHIRFSNNMDREKIANTLSRYFHQKPKILKYGSSDYQEFNWDFGDVRAALFNVDGPTLAISSINVDCGL